MSSRSIEQVLKDLGWADGVNVPVADEENKKLEREIEERMKKKAELIIESEDVQERFASMASMRRNIINEKDRNEQVLSALSRQIESEMSSLKLTEMQYKTTSKDTQKMKDELVGLKERDTKNKEDIKRISQKLEELKKEIQWGEEALFAWEEDIAHYEQDNSFMQYVMHQDNQLLSKTYCEIEMAREDNVTLKEIYLHIVNQVAALETEVGSSCTIIRGVNKEKLKLIDDWQNAMNLIRDKEEEIRRKQEETDDLKKILRIKYQKFLELRSAYEKKRRNNDELEDDEVKLKGSIEKVKINNINRKNELNQINGEMDVYHNSLSQLASRVESLRARNREVEKSYNAKIVHANALREENGRILSAIHSLGLETKSEETKSAEAEEVYKMGQKAKFRVVKEIERTQEVICKLQSEIPKIKCDIGKRMDEYNDLVNLNEHLIRQTEITKNEISEMDLQIYAMEYEYMEISGRVFDAKFRTESNVTTTWKQKIEELEGKMRQKKVTYNYLKTEAKRAQDKLQGVKLSLKIVEAEREKYNDEMTQLNNILSNMERDVLTAQTRYNESQLRLNMVKVQAKALKDAVAKGGSSMCQLEKESVSLQMAMRERQLEIEAQKELLIAKKKALMEEKSSLKRSIEHLNIRVRQLKSKYDIAIDMLGKSEEGDQVSVARVKIKCAQEKCELQQLGDDLESSILKVEKEIGAMETTLRLMNVSNDAFRQNLDPIAKDGPEMQLKNKLENECFRVMNILKEKNTLIEQINEEIQELLEKLDELDAEEHKIHEEWKLKDREIADLERDLAKKQLQLERADKQIVKLKAHVAKMKDPPQFKFLSQRDMDVRIKSEINNCALQQLGELAINYIETGPMVNRYLAEKGLSLPTKSNLSHGSSRNSMSVSLISFGSSKSLESDKPVPSIRPESFIYDPSIICSKQKKCEFGQ